MSLRERFEKRRQKENVLKDILFEDLQLVAGVVMVFVLGFILGL